MKVPEVSEIAPDGGDPVETFVPPPIIANVEVALNEGTEVLRKPTSQAQISTRTAVQRTPSGRSAPTSSRFAPSAAGAGSGKPVAKAPEAGATPPSAKASSKLPLVVGAGVLGVVVIVAVVAIAMSGGAKPQQPATNEGNAQAKDTPRQPKEPTEREKILRELENPALNLDQLVALFARGRDAKLEKSELEGIARRSSQAAATTSAANLSSTKLLTLARDFRKSELETAAVELLNIVVARGEKEADGRPAASYVEAQKALGRELAQFDKLLARCDVLIEGDVEGAVEMRESITGLRDEARSDWVPAGSRARLATLLEQLENGEAILKRLNSDDPFRPLALASYREFLKTPEAKGTWSFVSAKPFVILVQHWNEKEPRVKARDRASVALKRILQDGYNAFVARYAEPMGLRMDPERGDAPLRIKFFCDQRSWFSHVRTAAIKVEAEAVVAGEPDFSVSTYHDSTQAERLAHRMDVLRAVLALALDLHHPLGAKGRTSGVRAASFCARELFLESMMHGIEGDETEGFRFTLNSRRLIGILREFNQKADPNSRRIEGLGGTAITPKEVLTCRLLGVTGDEEFAVRTVLKNHLMRNGYDRDGATRIGGTSVMFVYRSYGCAFFQFLYNHEKDGKPLWREGYLRFLLADLKGEHKQEDTYEAFKKALGIDDAAFAQIDKAFRETYK